MGAVRIQLVGALAVFRDGSGAEASVGSRKARLPPALLAAHRGAHGEVVVRRIEDRYQSGLVEVRWIAECVICSAHADVGTEALARQWETAHAQHRCGHRLVRDETGRGWVPDQFATPGGRRG
jgi:hypothetical protein